MGSEVKERDSGDWGEGESGEWDEREDNEVGEWKVEKGESVWGE